jgi:hypothetical protein
MSPNVTAGEQIVAIVKARVLARARENFMGNPPPRASKAFLSKATENNKARERAKRIPRLHRLSTEYSRGDTSGGIPRRLALTLARLENARVIPLPSWMRKALYATAVMNAFGACMFLPSAGALRDLAGLPAGGEPFYLALCFTFVALLGVGYLCCAVRGSADRLFITIAAVGKLGFFLLLVSSWAGGGLPIRAPLTGAADLFFAVLFFAWLYGTYAPANANVVGFRAHG